MNKRSLQILVGGVAMLFVLVNGLILLLGVVLHLTSAPIIIGVVAGLAWLAWAAVIIRNGRRVQKEKQGGRPPPRRPWREQATSAAMQKLYAMCSVVSGGMATMLHLLARQFPEYPILRVFAVIFLGFLALYAVAAVVARVVGPKP